MHTSMFIWKPHPGKLKEMTEMVITIRDHCRRIGGANEVNCAALQGSFFDSSFKTKNLLNHWF